MKKICICFLLLVSTSLFGQFNLVPNPSFEDMVSCPNSTNQVDRAIGWYPSRNSPDYFNQCDSINGILSVPSNFQGYQYSHTGVAYCGFISYTHNGPNYREDFTCQLLDSLVIGKKYSVAFYVSWAGKLRMASNKMGILFSTSNYDTLVNAPIGNYCQIYTDSIIIDSVNWTLIQKSFIADSNYSYLTLGNFFDSSLVDTIHPFPSSTAYYYVDDISVTADTTTSVSELNPLGDLKIHPNPASDFIAISFDKSQDATIRLVDLLGNTILTSEVINKKECSINVSAVAAGCYFLQIVNKRTGTTTTKKIMIN